MSIRELYEWYEYYSEEPFMNDRVEIQLANIGYMVSSFGGGKSKHEDFMITGKDIKKEIPKPKELEKKLKDIFGGIGKN